MIVNHNETSDCPQLPAMASKSVALVIKCMPIALIKPVIYPFIQFYQLHKDDYHDKTLLLVIKAPVLDILEHPIKLVCRIPHLGLTCDLGKQRIGCNMRLFSIFLVYLLSFSHLY